MIFNNEKIINHIDAILFELGIKFKKNKNRVSFPCPIHGGNKAEGCSIFIDGTKSIGNWNCWTNHCEATYGRGIVNFVKATLSASGNEVSLNDTIKWIEKLTGESITTTQTDEDKNKYRFINIANELNKADEKELGIPRVQLRQSLVFPAQYFIQRGFSKEILDKYDVGFCNNQHKQMFERVVVPVYDDNGNNMIGCVGRTIKPQCVRCEKYHKDTDPCPVSSFEEYQTSKWINSKGFNAEKYFYNLWFAKDYINLYNTVIFVEGQGDVWRLEEADIHIGLGLFGASIKDHQILKLEKLPVINVIVASDSDLAGLKCKEQVMERLSRSYNVIPLTLPKKDIGDMSIQEVKDFFQPHLKKYVHQPN